MKNFILVIASLLSVQSFAQVIDAGAADVGPLAKIKVLGCTPAQAGMVPGLLSLTDKKHMTEFTVDGQLVWAVNLETEKSTVDVIKLKDLNVNQLPLIKGLINLANPKIKDVKAIKLSMVNAKSENDATETLVDRINRISDDAAGYMYLETLNSKNKVTGNSVLAAWAGLYKDCK